MKLAIVYWTFGKDAELLAQSLRSIERLRRNNPDDTLDVYVRDDASLPLAAVPEGVDYKTTNFDRNGNLNGLPCIQGMLAEHLAIAKAGGYDWVCKVDCDTYVNDIEWLRACDAETSVSAGTYNHHAYAHGFCYAYTAEGLARIADLLQKDHIIEALHQREAYGSKLPEDCIFGLLAPMTRLRPNRFRVVGRGNAPGSGRAGFFAYKVPGGGPLDEMPEASALQSHYAVTFKAMSWGRTPEQREQDRALAVENMTKYADDVDAMEEKTNA